MKQKRPPGPVGTSCLTCKRRRKKCDQGRPACERCIKGGFECLGYGHIQDHTVTAVASSSSGCARTIENISTHFVPSESVWLGYGGACVTVDQELDQACSVSTMFSSQSTELSLPQPTEFNYGILAPEISTYGLIIPSPDFSRGIHRPDLSFDTQGDVTRIASVGNHQPLLLSTNNQSWELAHSPASPQAAPIESEIRPNSNTIDNLRCLISPVEPRTARTLSTLSPDARQAITFILSQDERLLSMMYFTPRRQQIIHFRTVVINRLQISSITRCAVFIGAKIVQSRLDRSASDLHTSLSRSVEQFEQKLLVSSQTAADPNGVQHRLTGFLEVSFLKMILNNGLFAYQLLRNAAPTFLQIIYSDPGLWPNPSGPPAVSLAHVISSTRYEVGHFAMMDITCAMAYGLPQIVEYDTSIPTIDNNNIHPIQHIQACPPELQICLAEINLRCSKGYISYDWHLIERRLVSYKPCLTHIEDLESWKLVAQLAVIESWRQVLLIYLYMAVCGVDSDDPRVQSAVQQIFQLFKTVPRKDPPRLYVNLMFQYLIAGACTRSEKQRAYVRKKLLDPFENELWLLPGSDFVPVLDHLWHGAAANGRAFKWSDYIFSRQTALPVPI